MTDEEFKRDCLIVDRGFHKLTMMDLSRQQLMLSLEGSPDFPAIKHLVYWRLYAGSGPNGGPARWYPFGIKVVAEHRKEFTLWRIEAPGRAEIKVFGNEDFGDGRPAHLSVCGRVFDLNAKDARIFAEQLRIAAELMEEVYK